MIVKSTFKKGTQASANFTLSISRVKSTARKATVVGEMPGLISCFAQFCLD